MLDGESGRARTAWNPLIMLGLELKEKYSALLEQGKLV